MLRLCWQRPRPASGVARARLPPPPCSAPSTAPDDLAAHSDAAGERPGVVVSPRGRSRRSRLRAGGRDADEHALVEPVQIDGRGFDLGRRAEGVLAGVDVLAAPEASEDFGRAVAHAAGLDVEQVAAVGLQRVADVAERGPVAAGRSASRRSRRAEGCRSARARRMSAGQRTIRRRPWATAPSSSGWAERSPPTGRPGVSRGSGRLVMPPALRFWRSHAKWGWSPNGEELFT